MNGSDTLEAIPEGYDIDFFEFRAVYGVTRSLNVSQPYFHETQTLSCAFGYTEHCGSLDLNRSKRFTEIHQNIVAPSTVRRTFESF